MKNLFIIILLFGGVARSYCQNERYIKIEQDGISPPRISSTIIAEQSSNNIQIKRADVFVVDTLTFNQIKKTIADCKLERHLSNVDFGILKVTLGLHNGNEDLIIDYYFTNSKAETKVFLKKILMITSKTPGVSKLSYWINDNVLKRLD